MTYIEKVIKDRNGNDKVVRVAVAGDGAIEQNPSWRGIEYGWDSDDIAPESEATQHRQEIQDWVVSHGGKIEARQVKVSRAYIPLIYSMGGDIAVVQFGDKSTPVITQWLLAAGFENATVIEHRVKFSKDGKRHTFSLMS